MDQPSGWSVNPGDRPPTPDDSWFPSPAPEAPPAFAPAAFPAPQPALPPSAPAFGGAQPTSPPFGAAPMPAQPGAAPSAPPPEPKAPRAPGGGGRLATGVALAAILAAGLGFGAGRLSSKATPSEVLAKAAAGSLAGGAVQTTGTTPAPLTGNEAEPAAAVAKVLSPAVVQLQTSADLGSGFIYDKSGLILTAAHVVGDSTTMRVRLADGTQTTGKVVGADTSTDVAVVRITLKRDLPVAVLALGSKVNVGQMAIAIGSPYGLDQTVTQGIVSAVGRAMQTTDGEVAMIQTDAPINPGNSGGALADRMGRIIGINDSIISGSSSQADAGNVGVGFAIPIDLAKSVADRLVSGKPIDQGYLGIEGSNATGSQAGALVTSVGRNSPASRAGLREGDVVVQFGDAKISGMEDLAAAVRTHQPGDEVTLRVLRNGTTQTTVTVTLGKYTN